MKNVSLCFFAVAAGISSALAQTIGANPEPPGEAAVEISEAPCQDSIGKQPVNCNFQGYYNADHPTGGAEWSLRLQIQFLFPK